MKRTNKFLALLLAVLMVVSVLPLTVAAEDAEVTYANSVSNGGNAVFTVEDFKALDGQSGDYYLANDIDFAGETFTTPYVVNSFNGTLNGNGHSLKNIELSYTLTADEYASHNNYNTPVRAGVFNVLANTNDHSTVVSNLTLDGVSIVVDATVADGTVTTRLEVGFLAGEKMFNKSGNVLTVNDVHVTDSYMEVKLGKFAATHSWGMGTANYADIGGLIGFSGAAHFNACSISSDTVINVTTDKADTVAQVGGIVGYSAYMINYRYSSVSNCVNEANITLAVAEGTTGSYAADTSLGGIVGCNKNGAAIENCRNVGVLSAPEGIKLGGIVGKVTKLGLTIVNCVADGNVYGSYDNDTYTRGFFVVNCKDTRDNKSAQNTEPTAVITDEAGLRAIDTTATNLYRLDKDITINATTGNLVAKLGGCLDGNGNTITVNWSNVTTGDSAIFKELAGPIVNLNLVTNATINGGHFSALAAIGKNSMGTFICNVNSKVNITNNNGSYVTAMVTGNDGTAYINCTTEGTITDNRTVDTYIAGYAGLSYQGWVGVVPIIGCDNRVNIEVTADKSKASAIAGFIARPNAVRANANTSRGLHLMVDCVNYGNITANKANCYVGSMFGYNDPTAVGTQANVMIDCANVGDLTGTNVGIAAGYSKNNTHITYILGFTNVGKINSSNNATYNSFIHSRNDASSGNGDAKIVNCTNSVAEMMTGASVRINDYTGIRFATKLDMDAVNALVAKYGEDAVVSYGTIIAPAAFVSAAGEFTPDALDALKDKTEAYENVTMYATVEADANAWYAGIEGVIAGSITGLDGLLDEALVGRGYFRITVGEEVVYESYADYAGGDIANNTRSVVQVAKAALAEIAANPNGGYYTDDDKSKLEDIIG